MKAGVRLSKMFLNFSDLNILRGFFWLIVLQKMFLKRPESVPYCPPLDFGVSSVNPS